MELTITGQAQMSLATKLENYSAFLLILNDGFNPFSSAEGCCLIGDRFLIVPTNEPIEPFTKLIQNETYRVYTSDYDALFLTGKLVLAVNPSAGTLILKNEGGILDHNVSIKELNAAN
ncbi:iron-sulfur cluster biosynthesis family protein [Erwinia sp. CPCC 100877]|nr:iron-sulfur cluster biosynthesis family protein [Erwinia sp. CPCC 100877]